MQAEPEHDLELDYFQSKLLSLLSSTLSEHEIIQALKDDPRLCQFKEYIDSWEPRMVDLAKRLTNKWGRKAV